MYIAGALRVKRVISSPHLEVSNKGSGIFSCIIDILFVYPLTMDTVAYYSLKNLSVKSWLRESMDYGKLSVLMTPWAREMYQGKIKFDLFEKLYMYVEHYHFVG